MDCSLQMDIESAKNDSWKKFIRFSTLCRGEKNFRMENENKFQLHLTPDALQTDHHHPLKHLALLMRENPSDNAHHRITQTSVYDPTSSMDITLQLL